MKNIVFKLNIINDSVKYYTSIIYDINSNYITRRNNNNKYIVNLLKNDLDIINDIIILIQHLSDFLVKYILNNIFLII